MCPKKVFDIEDMGSKAVVARALDCSLCRCDPPPPPRAQAFTGGELRARVWLTRARGQGVYSTRGLGATGAAVARQGKPPALQP